MLPEIESLVSELQHSWARARHEEAAFPEIAARALERPLELGLEALARGVFAGVELPRQLRSDQAFGQPALTLYYGERLIVEALLWQSGSPAIHQHAFSGAFRVLVGSSVHSRYSYSVRCAVSPALSLGRLDLEAVELLREGAVVPIPRGKKLIHAAFHLDDPTLTIVARTPSTSEPEYCYLPPGVAFDPAARSAGLHKRLQLLDNLSGSRPDLYAECVDAVLRSADLYDGLAVMMRVGRHPIDEETYLAFARRLDDAHGDGLDPLPAALVEDRRRSNIVGLRASVSDPEQRFFLAILLGVTRSRDILNAMMQRYGRAEIAAERLATGVRRVLGFGDGAQPLVDASVNALLDEVPVDGFADHLVRVQGEPLAAETRERLTAFYRQVTGHPLLSHLRGGGRSPG